MVRTVRLADWSDLQPVWKNARQPRPPSSRVFFSVTQTQMCFTRKSCSNELNFVVYTNNKQAQLEATTAPNDMDIDYNFAIGGDGYVYECRGWGVPPVLPVSYKTHGVHALYIAFVGWFNIYPPSLKMFKAKDELLEFARVKGYLLDNYEEYNI